MSTPIPYGRYNVNRIRFTLRDMPADPRHNDLLNEPALVRALLPEIFATLEPDQEHTVVLCLTARNRLIGFRTLYSGTLDRAIVEPREFYKTALALGAAGIIAAHNHPSGDPTPSREDREFTRRLAAAGEALGIRLLDHFVYGTRGAIVAFREAGLM